MKKKKNWYIFLTLMLAILGVMLYSYDFLTTKVSEPNIIIKTGKLDIKAYDDDKWIPLNEEHESEFQCDNYKNIFINAKPGDIFIKKIIIKNTGTLKQNLTFSTNENLPYLVKRIFDIEITGINNKENTLLPKETKEIVIKLILKNENNNNNQDKSIDFKQLKVVKFLTVEGNQLKSI